MSGFNVKKNDTVMVITGKEKGKIGKIVSVDRDNNRIAIDGINKIKKAKKARSAKDVGGIIEQPGTIDISNVMPVCGACKKPTRVGNVFTEEDGKKVKKRVCKKCGAFIDEEMAKSKRIARKTNKKVETAKKEEKAKKETKSTVKE